RLAKATGLAVREASNHFHAQATLDVMVATHGALRTIATSLWKIGSDVRLMGTGPIAGLGELRLPETQPGSSIMPGKVNPEIVERSPMLATALNPVIGYDEADKIAKESIRTGRSIRQLARGRGVAESALTRVLDLGKMTKPGLEGPGGAG